VRPGKKFPPTVLTEEELARPHFARQAYKPATLLVLGLLAAHCCVYCSAVDYTFPLVSGYLHTDAYLAVLHMWLDDPVTLEHPMKVIAKVAWEFQHHHEYPDDVFHKNHVLTIDLLVRGTGVLLLVTYWSCGLNTWVLTHFLSVSFWGYVGAANHVAMHCRSHGRAIPYIFRKAQDLGFLMQREHHKAHHTPPFECYFSFLQGLNVLYTCLYTRLLQHHRLLLTILFVALQPPAVVLALGGAALTKPHGNVNLDHG